MLLNDIAILGLGTEDSKSKSNKETYLSLVQNDTALVTKVKDFLLNLKSNQDLQHELEELKTLQYQQAHLQAQKQLTKTFISLKSLHNHVKKIQPASKDDVPIAQVLECVQIYQACKINYQGIVDSIPKDTDQTGEVIRANDKLKGAVEDLKRLHTNTHKKVREVLKNYGKKLVESYDLPIKKYY